MTWLAPVLALFGALVGSLVAPWFTRRLDSKTANRALIYTAIDAVTSAQVWRWNATSVGAAIPTLSSDAAQQLHDDLNRERLSGFVESMNSARLSLSVVAARRPLRTWQADTGWEITEAQAPVILDELRELLKERRPLS
ncbi:hypothetical protein [Isoptericola sp. NPDC057559]|uniref:hypothetical protein n=1 Tax=Isoptericola sp. NPDC057559 TaxID=3346168 RepID=UPI0036A8AF72